MSRHQPITFRSVWHAVLVFWCIVKPAPPPSPLTIAQQEATDCEIERLTAANAVEAAEVALDNARSRSEMLGRRFVRLVDSVEPMPAYASELYRRLESLSKVLESTGRIDESEHPDSSGAYATILDAMRVTMDLAAQRRGSVS